MRISAIQLKSSKSVEDNVERALRLIEKSNSDLIVLPELFDTGYYPENYELGDISPLINFSRDCDAVIVAGSVEGEYNTAFVIHRGEVIGRHRKTKLFPLTHEKDVFKPGSELKAIDTPLCRIGVLICYELRFPEIAKELVRQGAEILTVLAVFPEERIEHWKILLRARAIENQVYVVGANCVGEFCGGNSMIVDPMGKVLAEAGREECVITAEVDLDYLREVRRKFPFR